MRIVIATSNQGKLRDFAAAATAKGIAVDALPDFSLIPQEVEDGISFEENACKKAEHYSLFAPGELVLADDSGLSVDALDGAPGVHSARYAATEHPGNSSDEANNARLLGELLGVDDQHRRARFVCVISAARDGHEVASFRGEAEGLILRQARGHQGFGYDPLFYSPATGKTFAELSPTEKALHSHRGAALRAFLAWASRQQPLPERQPK